MKKILIGLAILALLAAAGFAAAPATVDLQVSALEEERIPASGWLESDRDPRVDVAEIPMAGKFRTSGFFGRIEAPEGLVVSGTVHKAGLRTGEFEGRGREIELEGRWASVAVTVR